MPELRFVDVVAGSWSVVAERVVTIFTLRCRGSWSVVAERVVTIFTLRCRERHVARRESAHVVHAPRGPNELARAKNTEQGG